MIFLKNIDLKEIKDFIYTDISLKENKIFQSYNRKILNEYKEKYFQKNQDMKNIYKRSYSQISQNTKMVLIILLKQIKIIFLQKN